MMFIAPLLLGAALALSGHAGSLLGLAVLVCCALACAFSLARRDVVGLVTAFIVLMVLIPANLTVQDLGAAGSPTTVVGMIALGWWILIKLGPGHDFSRGRHPIRIGMYIFGATIFLSYSAAFSREISPLEVSGASRGLLEMLGLMGIALLTADGVKDRKSLDILARRLVFWITILAILGVYQFFTKSTFSFYSSIPGFRVGSGGGLLIRGGFARIQGTAESSIEFGLVVAAAFPIAIHYAMQATRDKRLLRWVGVGIMGLAIPMSVSRTGFIGLAIGFIAMCVGFTARQRLVGVLLLLLFAGVLSAGIPHLLGTVEGSFLSASSDSSVIHREQDLNRSGDLLQGDLWFGRGIGTYIPSEFTPPRQPIASLDNQYLGSLIETGMVGLFGLILLLLIWLFSALGARRRAIDASTRELALALAAGSLIFAFGLYTFDVFGFTISSSMMFVLIGLTGTLWRLTMEARHSQIVELQLVRSDA